MRIVFWQNIISPHQSSYLMALATMGCDVVVIAHEAISADRQQQGWGIPELPGIQVVIAPDGQQIKEIIQQDRTSSIHVFAGAREHELGVVAMREAIRAGVRMGLLSESADTSQGFMCFLRRIKYGAEAYTTGRKFDFVLAMGQRGVRWFTSCGYPAALVHPFGYFTEAHDAPVVAAATQAHFRFIFVGRCIRCKDIVILLQALATLKDIDWELTIVGDGPLKAELAQLAVTLGISEKVNFKGQLENLTVLKEIANSDLLVLPSRSDGWGAVVNEALQCGVPVVCSDSCGAGDLLHEAWRGEIFATGSVTGLAQALHMRIKAGKLTNEAREKLLRWSSCLSGEMAAKYFLAVLQHTYDRKELPTPPWY